LTLQSGRTARKLFEDEKEKEQRREKKEERRRGSMQRPTQAGTGTL
jgi:hypothetical protein